MVGMTRRSALTRFFHDMFSTVMAPIKSTMDWMAVHEDEVDANHPAIGEEVPIGRAYSPEKSVANQRFPSQSSQRTSEDR